MWLKLTAHTSLASADMCIWERCLKFRVEIDYLFIILINAKIRIKEKYKDWALNMACTMEAFLILRNKKEKMKNAKGN